MTVCIENIRVNILITHIYIYVNIIITAQRLGGGEEFGYLFKSCSCLTALPNLLQNDQFGTQFDGL